MHFDMCDTLSCSCSAHIKYRKTLSFTALVVTVSKIQINEQKLLENSIFKAHNDLSRYVAKLAHIDTYTFLRKLLAKFKREVISI